MSTNTLTAHPPATPVNGRPQAQPNPPQQQPQSQQQQPQQQLQNGAHTPSSDPRMNPPPVPQHFITPQREMRENSVQSSTGTPQRKPRQNLDERDHQMMLKHCLEQRHNFKEGNKAAFWTGVNNAFQQDTGKILAQMSATVGRLVEARRRQISDWENGVVPNKPGGELNDMLDQWIEYLKAEEPEGEAERMRQVEVKRKLEESRKEARRQALAAEQLAAQHSHQGALVPHNAQGLQGEGQHGVLVPVAVGTQQIEHQGEEAEQRNGEDFNGYRPNKRKRRDETGLATPNGVQAQIQAEVDWHSRRQSDQHQHAAPLTQPQPPPQSSLPTPQMHAPPPQTIAHPQHPQPPHYVMQYQHPPPPEPVRKVVVEGALTKDDWREIMGNDARLRALETKVDRIELLLSQNNKMLLQLVQNQSQQGKDRERDRENNRHDRHESAEEDRVPVHLDAEFERDYLTGRYSKTPFPIN